MDPQRIGTHIRRIRQQRELSLQGLAELSGFSKGYLSKLEHGLAQAPIATLMTIAKALKVQVHALFDGQAKQDQSCVLTKKADRERIETSKERPYAYERLAVGSQFKLSPYLIHIDGETVQDKTYQHDGEEIIHMISGQCKYRVGTEIHHLRKGDTLTFDATLPHGPIAIAGKAASYFAVFADH